MHDFDRFIVRGPVDRIWGAVLPSVHERIARRIPLARAGAVNQLRGERDALREVSIRLRLATPLWYRGIPVRWTLD